MKRIITSLRVLAVLTMAAASVFSRQAKWTIGMSQCNLGEPWRVQMNADIRKAAEEHPEFRMVYKDAQNDNLRQSAHVE